MNVSKNVKKFKHYKWYFFAQRILLELTSVGFRREEAYKMVQKNALDAWKENSSFYNKILNDKKITNKIPVNKLKKLFDFSYHTKKINIIFKFINRYLLVKFFYHLKFYYKMKDFLHTSNFSELCK